MGALYVKDHEAFKLAKELAERRGLTKSAAVKLALTNELAKDNAKRTFSEIAAELRRTSTLPKANVGVADKVFFDGLYED